MLETMEEKFRFNPSNSKGKPSWEKKPKKVLQEREDVRWLEKRVLGKKHGLFDVVGKLTSGRANEVEEDKYTEKHDVSKTELEATWVDEDDDNTKIPYKRRKHATTKSGDRYVSLLRRHHQRIVGTPNWAMKEKKTQVDSDEDDVDEMMRCGELLIKSPLLEKGEIGVKKMKDLNEEARLEGPEINAVEFNPTYTLALVAGNCGTASVFQVDGISNNKLQTIKFKGFPIDCAHFSRDGAEFYVGSKSYRSFFYYDMMVTKSVQVPFHHSIGGSAVNMSNFQVSPDGKFIVICGEGGNIHLLAAKTKEWIGNLKMNNNVVDICFNNDGSTMYSYGDEGEIYEWDMNTRYCVKNLKECFQGTKMALSRNSQILATGSSSGSVNLYKMPTKSNCIKPIKIVNNLRTSITSLQFNSTSEILAIASNQVKNAVRLLHFPSMTVFSNFPGFKPNISQARVMNFSPCSGFFAIGNDQQKVLLYRLRSYENY